MESDPLLYLGCGNFTFSSRRCHINHCLVEGSMTITVLNYLKSNENHPTRSKVFTKTSKRSIVSLEYKLRDINKEEFGSWQCDAAFIIFCLQPASNFFLEELIMYFYPVMQWIILGERIVYTIICRALPTSEMKYFRPPASIASSCNSSKHPNIFTFICKPGKKMQLL